MNPFFFSFAKTKQDVTIANNNNNNNNNSSSSNNNHDNSRMPQLKSIVFSNCHIQCPTSVKISSKFLTFKFKYLCFILFCFFNLFLFTLFIQIIFLKFLIRKIFKIKNKIKVFHVFVIFFSP